MTSFASEKTGRVLLLHLTKGDDIITSVTNAAAEAGISSGILSSGIGSLRKFTYHYIGAVTDTPGDICETIEKPLELASLQGIILEGKPHLHAVVSEGGHNCCAGHVELGCEVQYLVEISIVEIPDFNVGRRAKEHDGVTHFEWL